MSSSGTRTSFPSALTLVESARDLLLDGHTQGAFARREDGSDIPVCDPSAVEFCGMGALVRASSGDMGSDAFLEAHERLTESLPVSLSAWNDMIDKSEMIGHYSETINTMKRRARV